MCTFTRRDPPSGVETEGGGAVDAMVELLSTSAKFPPLPTIRSIRCWKQQVDHVDNEPGDVRLAASRSVRGTAARWVRAFPSHWGRNLLDRRGGVVGSFAEG